MCFEDFLRHPTSFESAGRLQITTPFYKVTNKLNEKTKAATEQKSSNASPPISNARLGITKQHYRNPN